MKISAVTTWPPYHEGIALYSLKLYSEIARSNPFEVEVIANRMGAAASEAADAEDSSTISYQRSWTRGPLAPLQILNMALKSKANVFHFQHGWFLFGKSLTVALIPILLLLLRLSRRPVIVTMHTVIRRNSRFSRNEALNIAVNTAVFAATKCLVTFASKVVVHSRLMKRVLENDYNCKKTKVTVIPHGVDKAERSNSSRHDQRGKEAEATLNILSLGFIRESKGLTLLLRAFKELHLNHPNARLTIVGSRHPHDEENYYGKLRSLVAKLRLEDETLFLHFIEEGLLNRILDETDIVVLLSLEKDLVESSGALARLADFEKPVICTRVPKFRSELTDGYDCIMADVETPTEICEAMEELIEDGETRRRIARALKRNVGNRYWNDVARLHVKLYKSFHRISQ